MSCNSWSDNAICVTLLYFLYTLYWAIRIKNGSVHFLTEPFAFFVLYADILSKSWKCIIYTIYIIHIASLSPQMRKVSNYMQVFFVINWSCFDLFPKTGCLETLDLMSVHFFISLTYDSISVQQRFRGLSVLGNRSRLTNLQSLVFGNKSKLRKTYSNSNYGYIIT